MDFQFEFDEEFQESDIIFSDDYSSDQGAVSNRNDSRRRNTHRSKSNKRNEHRRSSVPVNIPGNSCSPSACSNFDFNFIVDFSDYNEDGAYDVVPPHVIVDKRTIESQIACSFNSFERNVVTRGRNLIQVRNSILKMTGFLES